MPKVLGGVGEGWGVAHLHLSIHGPTFMQTSEQYRSVSKLRRHGTEASQTLKDKWSPTLLEG